MKRIISGRKNQNQIGGCTKKFFGVMHASWRLLPSPGISREDPQLKNDQKKKGEMMTMAMVLICPMSVVRSSVDTAITNRGGCCAVLRVQDNARAHTPLPSNTSPFLPIQITAIPFLCRLIP